MTKPKARKSVKKAGHKAGALVPQKHGGAIHQGPPGNPVAGTGRPPDTIRAAMREKLDIALPKLWAEYESGQLDRLGFANFLAKYGLGSKELVITNTNAQAFFECVQKAIVELHGEPAADQIKARAVALMDAKA